MAAGVHHALVPGAVRLVLIVFRDREGVHVRPEADGEAGLFGIDGGYDGVAAVAVRLVGDAGGIQLTPDQG